MELTTCARPDANGMQMIEVEVNRGYRPASIVARADAPLRIIFHRSDDDPCSERVVFSSPHVDRRLSGSGPTVVDLPGQPQGEIRFTCGMGRYSGRIVLVEDPGRGWLDRLLGFFQHQQDRGRRPQQAPPSRHHGGPES
jgi:Uncharacterized protein conserved in bacteria